MGIIHPANELPLFRCKRTDQSRLQETLQCSVSRQRNLFNLRLHWWCFQKLLESCTYGEVPMTCTGDKRYHRNPFPESIKLFIVIHRITVGSPLPLPTTSFTHTSWHCLVFIFNIQASLQGSQLNKAVPIIDLSSCRTKNVGGDEFRENAYALGVKTIYDAKMSHSLSKIRFWRFKSL